MNTEIYLKCVIACLIGNICHILYKGYSLSVDYKKANMPFSFLQYIKDDKMALLVDFALSFALVYVADEFVNNEFLMDKIKIFFLFIGFTGSYVVLQIMSVAKKKFRTIIDEKTDRADGKVKD